MALPHDPRTGKCFPAQRVATLPARTVTNGPSRIVAGRSHAWKELSMEDRPALILAQIRLTAYTAKRNRARIDPDTLLRIIEGKGRA